MPKSKRNKQIDLSKTRKHGLEGKKKLFEEVRSCVETYTHLFIFSVNDMRNSKIKSVREQWKHSRFFIGKNKVMAKALGLSPEDEFRMNIHKIGHRLKGERGLLFSNQSVEDVLKWFSSYSEGDFARSGNRATETVCLQEGPLSQFPHNLEPYLRLLGLPTSLKKGIIHLVKDHTVCNVGDILTPETAKIVKLLGYEMAEFYIKIECVWSQDGSFSDFTTGEESKENLHEPNSSSLSKKTSIEVASMDIDEEDISEPSDEMIENIIKNRKSLMNKPSSDESSDEEMSDSAELQTADRETTQKNSSVLSPEKSKKRASEENDTFKDESSKKYNTNKSPSKNEESNIVNTFGTPSKNKDSIEVNTNNTPSKYEDIIEVNTNETSKNEDKIEVNTNKTPSKNEGSIEVDTNETISKNEDSNIVNTYENISKNEESNIVDTNETISKNEDSNIVNMNETSEKASTNFKLPEDEIIESEQDSENESIKDNISETVEGSEISEDDSEEDEEIPELVEDVNVDNDSADKEKDGIEANGHVDNSQTTTEDNEMKPPEKSLTKLSLGKNALQSPAMLEKRPKFSPKMTRSAMKAKKTVSSTSNEESNEEKKPSRGRAHKRHSTGESPAERKLRNRCIKIVKKKK